MNGPERILFIGSKGLGLAILQQMRQLAPDRLIGALTIDDSGDSRSALPLFKKFCSANNINLKIAKNRLGAEKEIAEAKPDLCIVCGWYWLIKKTTLGTAKYGFIGIHNSLLPKYRGGSPLVWAIINGEKETGFSFFTLQEGMDDGDIWLQESVTIGQEDYVSDVMEKLQTKTIRAFSDNYLKILDGRIKPYKQNNDNATYYALRKPEDGRIDWQKSAKEIYDFIRAQAKPYPGAFTFLGKEKYIIWKAHLSDKKLSGIAGQVANIEQNMAEIICGDGAVIILELYSKRTGLTGGDRFI